MQDSEAQSDNTGSPDHDEPTATSSARRRERAIEYFEEHLNDQQGWYDRKASRYKACYCWLSFVIIAAGATSSVVQLFAPGPSWVVVLTASLGAIIVVVKGVDHIWNLGNVWTAYRRAAEKMKCERRLFINSAGPYSGISDEEREYRRFVERVEQIIAEEQMNFWSDRDGTPEPKNNRNTEAKEP